MKKIILITTILLSGIFAEEHKACSHNNKNMTGAYIMHKVGSDEPHQIFSIYSENGKWLFKQFSKEGIEDVKSYNMESEVVLYSDEKINEISQNIDIGTMSVILSSIIDKSISESEIKELLNSKKINCTGHARYAICEIKTQKNECKYIFLFFRSKDKKIIFASYLKKLTPQEFKELFNNFQE